MHVRPELRIFLFVLLLSIVSCNTEDPTPSIIISNVTAIDPTNGNQGEVTVVIQGNKIALVTSDEIEPKGTDQAIDGSGKYLIPGLWDAHVHVTFDENIAPAMFDLFLANGITSLRDTGALLDKIESYKKDSDENPSKRPRLKIAGPLVDGTPVVYNGEDPGFPEIGTGVSTKEEARAKVNELADAGVDLIKAYEMLSPEVFEEVIAAAKERGLVVTGHTPLSMTADVASSMGMRSMEHMRNVEMACTADADRRLADRKRLLEEGKDDPGRILRSRLHTAHRMDAVHNQDEARTAEVIQSFAKNGTWQTPTLGLFAGSDVKHYADPEWLDNYQYLPEASREAWTERSAMLKDSPVEPSRLEYASWGYNMTKRMSDAGVGIMAGTDTPIYFLTPGFSLHHELRILVEKVGLTPMQALEASIRRPAEYFNLQDTIGHISNGMIADLVLLDANPLESIRNTTKINSVIKDGMLYNRAALDSLLNATAALD